MANRLVFDVKEIIRRLRNRGISLEANRQYPSIPIIDDTPQSHTAALRALREAVEIGERRSPKAALDSFVRLYELEQVLGGFVAGETTVNYLPGIGGEVPPFIGAKAKRTTNLTVATGATVALAFDTEIYDTDDIWDVAAANQFFAPVDGHYTLIVTVYWNADAASVGGRGIYIHKNASTAGPESAGSFASEVQGQRQQAVIHAQLAEGEYFDVSVTVTNATAADCVVQNATAAFFAQSSTAGGSGGGGGGGSGLEVIGTPAHGDILFYNGTGWEVLPAGTDDQILATNGPAADPEWVSFPSESGAQVRKTTALSLVAGTWTLVPFNTEDFDTDGYWSVTNPGRFTIPADGWYIATGWASFGSASSRGLVAIAKNGTPTVAGNEVAGGAYGAAGTNERGQAAIVGYFVTGDYLEMWVHSSATGALEVTQSQPRFGIVRVQTGPRGPVGPTGPPVYDIPKSATTSGVLTAAENGYCIPATGNVTINASVFSAGNAFNVYNNTSGSIYIIQGAGMTLRLPNTASTGNRTLLQRGIASIWFNSATEAIVVGTT